MKKRDEEIFRLRNEIIDLKGAARVFIRVRPMIEAGEFPFVFHDGKTMTHIPTGKKHHFDGVFPPDATTKVIFKEVEHVIVSTVTSGGLACIFSYGQTSSGKTHTMIGGGNMVISLYLYSIQIKTGHLVSIDYFK